MKVVCVDKAAADRVRLQKFLDSAFEECRRAVGHLSLTLFSPASRDEALLSSPPDVIAIGSGFSVEEAYSVCRDLSETFPTTPVVLFLSPEAYSLRALRRFERLCADIFSTNDPAIRIVHKLSVFDNSRAKNATGLLLAINGVKGGVGATTLIGALAHAAETFGKSSVLLDLSLRNNLAHYMGTERLQSPDFATLLSDRLSPHDGLVSRFIVSAPNGVDVCLSPAGGHDVRELWLRDSQSFEATLAVLDVLRSTYDLVLVDMAQAEGVLPFALNARADRRVLVSSNDPASIHLLSAAVNQLADTPGEGRVNIILNQLHERGLDKEDMLDFLCISDSFSEEMAVLPVLPHDGRGAQWIGTGNTFYTESSRATQHALELILEGLLVDVVAAVAGDKPKKITNSLSKLKKLLVRPIRQVTVVEKAVRALPLLQPTAQSEQLVKHSSSPLTKRLYPIAQSARLRPISKEQTFSRKADDGEISPELVATASVFSPLYESPICVEQERE